MVANTRDEPFGGIQGISRARKEGMNPKLYGASKGFVPNFFNFTGNPSQYGGSPTGATGGASQEKQTKDIRDTIGTLISLQIVSSALTGALSEAGETAQKFGSALGGALIGIQSIKELGKTEGGISFGQFGKNFSRAGKEIRQGAVRSLLGAGGGFTTANIGKGLGLVAKGFLRFAPLIGQVVLGFDILNGVLKAFGVDIVKIVSDSFRGVNDAGQEAKESIEKFAQILEESGGKISSQKAFELLNERANALAENLNFRTAGLEPKTEEEKTAARTQLLNEKIESIFKNLTGQSIAENIVKLGERQVETKPYYSLTEEPTLITGAQTVQDIAPGSVFAASIAEAYKDSLKVLQNLDEESVKKIAANKGILGKDFQETKDNLLKSAIKSIDQQLKAAIDPSLTKGKTEEFKVDYFKSLAADNIFVRFANALARTPEQAETFEKRLEQNVEAFLIEEEKFFNRVNRDFSNAVDFFSSLTSTKTFGSLGIGEQTNLLNTLDIGKSQQAFIKNLTDFRKQAADALLGDFRKNALQAGLNTEQQKRIESFILEFDPANIQAFNEELSNFVETLSGVDQTVFNGLRRTAGGLSDQQADLLSKRENELKLLQFSISERTAETKAIQFFNKEIVNFGKTINDAEKGIQDLNSQIKIIDLKANYQTEISDAFALSSEQALRGRQNIELKAAQEKALKEAQITEKQARIDLQRTLFTKENTVALNRNTEMLKKLLDIQSIAVESSLKEELKKFNDQIVSATYSGNQSQADQLTQQYNQLSNVITAIQNRRAVLSNQNGSLGVVGTGTKKFPSVQEMISGYGALVAGGQSPEQAIESYVKALGYSEESSIIVRDALIQYNYALDKGINTQNNLNNELLTAQELERNKNTLLTTYAASLSAQIKAADDALRRPMSAGQFAAQTRMQRTNQRMLEISQRGIQNPEQLRKDNPQEYERLTSLNNPAVREYLSSFGYGFDEAMSKVEERTLDFRNQLGKEIPDLFSQNLAQGLNDAISGAKTLKEALMDAATSFFQEITRKNISNLADLVTGGIGNLVGGFFQPSIPKAIPVGPDEYASGGLIKGGSGTKDDVPAMLMGGEYVVKKSAVNKYGKGFFDAINSGRMRGYATGGMVDPQTFPTQTGRGGFFTPGDYGQGAITGKNELLTFATQSFTGGQYDYMGGFGMGGATVSLEPESARLSALGREGSPMFERVQQSKDEAFKVYLEGLQKEKEYAELLDQIAKNEKARKKQLQMAIISAVVSSVASYAGSAMSAGAKNATAAAAKTAAASGQTLSTGAKFMAGFKGMFTGAGGQGGLANIFKGTGTQLSDLVIANQNAKIMQALGQTGSIGKIQGATPSFLGKFNLSNIFSKFKLFSNKSSTSQMNRSGVGTLLPELTPDAIKGMGLISTPSDGFYNPHPISQRQRRAAGGLISGGSNIRDDVPAMLTGGEFVLNNRATQRIGLQNLNRLNSGAPVSSEASSPEMTQTLIAKLDELIQTTANSSKENVVVNVSTNETGGQTIENPTDAERDLQKKIRQAVLDVIAQEKRLGGSLEKSR
jgi:hypothetical protein